MVSARSFSAPTVMRALRRLGLWTVLVTLLQATLPGTSNAQFCADNDPCPTNQAPVVSLVGDATTAQASYTFAVFASDDGMLAPASLQLWLNGALQTSWGQSPLSSPWTTHSTPGQVTLSAGTNTLIVQMCETRSSPLCGADTLVVTYAPPPTPPATAAPVLSLAQRNDGRLLDGCATCSTMTASYATPEFYLNGSPRSVVVRYSSEQANPVGYVEVDAHVWAQTAPTRLGIRLERNGSPLTLANGGTESFVVGGLGTYRLAAWFDAWNLPSDSIDVSVIVTAYYGPAGAPTDIKSDTLDPVRVLVHNARLSPYGRGWTVAGDARLHKQHNGNLVVSDGAGSMEYHQLAGCGGSPWTCSYTQPAGTVATIARVLVPTGLLNPPDTVWVRDNKDGSHTYWTNVGLLDSLVDAYGNTTTFERMTSGDVNRLYRIKLATAVGATAITKYVTFGYDGDGKLSSITLPDGRASTFSVTSGSGGTLNAVVDPDGVTALSATYSFGFMMTVAGRNAKPDSLTYDGHWQLFTRRGPVVAIEGGTSRDSLAIYSLRSRLLSNNATSATGSPMANATLADSAMMRLSGRNGTSTELWSAVGGGARLVRSKTSAGKVEEARTTFDAAHLPVLTSTTGQAGQSLEWSGGRLVKTADVATGLSTSYHYDGSGRIDSITVNGVRMVRHFYTGSSYAPDSSRSDTANVIRYTHDARGRLLTVKDANNVTVTHTYETTHGNLASSVRSGTGVPTTSAAFTYDASGSAITTTDPLGRVFTNTYNNVGRVTQEQGPLSTSTTRSYNDATGTYGLTDPKGQQYTTHVNAAGLATSQVDPTGARDSVTYDADGRIAVSRSRRGDEVRFTYDGFGRVITRTHKISGQTTPDTTSFAYDSLGRWVAARNAESIDTLTVDAGGRASQAVSRRGAVRLNVDYGYTAGTLSSRIVVGGTPSSGSAWSDTLGLAYDVQRNANVFRDFGGKDTKSLLDKSGRLVTDTFPTSSVAASKVRRSTSYSATGDVIAQTFTSSGDYLLSRTYGDHDALGRIGSISRQNAPAPIVRLHEYDALGRLVTYQDKQTYDSVYYFQTPWDPYGDCPGCFILDSTVTTVTNVLRSATYVYDSVHNRRDLNSTIATGNRVTAMDSWGIAYDAAGHISQRWKGADTLTYTWNGLGQLIQVVAPGGATTTYGYDGFGRRVRKTVNGDTTRYLLDGDRVMAETDGVGAVRALYSYFPGVDRPHAMLRNNKRYYFAQDVQGNIIGLMDSVGHVAQTYNYTPYGEAVDDMGESVVNPYRYKGREWDAEARLYYMRARYYDPMLGRFLSEDPIGLAGGINPAMFVDGDPVNLYDPDGLTPCPRVNTTCPWGLPAAVSSVAPRRTLNQHIFLLGASRPGFTSFLGNDAHTEDHFRLSGPPGLLESLSADCKDALKSVLVSMAFDAIGFGALKRIWSTLPDVLATTYRGLDKKLLEFGKAAVQSKGVFLPRVNKATRLGFDHDLAAIVRWGEDVAGAGMPPATFQGSEAMLSGGDLGMAVASLALGFIPGGNSVVALGEALYECGLRS